MDSTTIQCPSCRQGIAPAEFVAACSHYWREVDAVRFTCPRCQETTDARIENSRIWLGYIYAAGSAHFCGMEEIAVEGLQAWRDGVNLRVRLCEEEWTVNGNTES